MWDLSHICKSWDEWQGSYRRTRRRIEAFKSRQGTLARAPRHCSTRSARWTAWARSAIASGITPRCSYDEDQRDNESTRAGSRCRSSSPAAAGQLLVQSRAAGDPARDHPRLDGRDTGAGRLPLRDREPVSRAGARARRTGRAPAVVCRAASTACRTTSTRR